MKDTIIGCWILCLASGFAGLLVSEKYAKIISSFCFILCLGLVIPSLSNISLSDIQTQKIATTEQTQSTSGEQLVLKQTSETIEGQIENYIIQKWKMESNDFEVVVFLNSQDNELSIEKITICIFKKTMIPFGEKIKSDLGETFLCECEVKNGEYAEE